MITTIPQGISCFIYLKNENLSDYGGPAANRAAHTHGAADVTARRGANELGYDGPYSTRVVGKTMRRAVCCACGLSMRSRNSSAALRPSSRGS